jgi:hypothetical protein
MDKVYLGVRSRGADGNAVTVSVIEDGVARSLPPRLDLRDHPAGSLEWGYGTDGPAQLALAVLADATGSDDYAVRHFHRFRLEIVSNLPWREWKLTEAQVRAWINEHHPLTDAS